MPDSAALVYLRPDVMMEPLVDRWYAWSHLISPATLAMNVHQRHLAIMQSYIDAPDIHAAAAKEPRFRGGPFVDYDRDRTAEIRELIASTRRSRSDLLRFAEGLTALDRLLQSEAKGYALETLYEQIPDALRGYVELVYDLNDQPGFRLIEPLLYRSTYHDTRGQSIVLSRAANDDRPFVLSTPRLCEPSEVSLQIPFSDPGIDVLFGALRRPQPASALYEAIGAGPESGICEMLTESAPPPYRAYEGKGVRWRYFGHACVLVETAGTSLLIDPWISYAYKADIPRYTFLDLPDRIDYALITHNHQDHLLIETILALRHRIRTVVVPRSGGGALQDPSMKLTLKALGFERVVEMDELDELPIDRGSITGIPFLGEHGDLNIRTKLAYLVSIDKHRLLFAADSCNIDRRLYQHIRSLFPRIDALFLGMECDGAPMSWLYGALRTRQLARDKDATRRFAGSNFDRAMDMVNTFDCREVYVYAMGMEPWLNHIMSIAYHENSNPIVASNRLIDECSRKGIVAERLFGEKETMLE
jgi:L-ascorbate metabolism protein UlaG (beta-lactamase superfamily)